MDEYAMPGSAAVPTPALVSGAVRKPPFDQRGVATGKGILAHLIIQAHYRAEHPGHFIVTERAVWIGDSKVTTISKSLEYVDRYVKLARKAAKAITERGQIRSLGDDGLWILLLYLIDLSSDESAAGLTRKKRFDIIDFGSKIITPVSQQRYAEAYEIKSISEAETKKGKTYISDETARYNETLQSLQQLLEELFDVTGLGSYHLRLGRTWPTGPREYWFGSNLLTFWLQEEGVICYKWFTYKERSAKQIWDSIRAIYRDPQMLFQTKSQLKPEAIIFLLLAGVAIGAAVVTIGGILGLLLVELLAVGGMITAGAVAATLARMAQSRPLMMTAASITAASAAARPEPNGKETQNSSQNLDPTTKNLDQLIAAVNNLEITELDYIVQNSNIMPTSIREASGGTPPTIEELDPLGVAKFVEVIVAELISQFMSTVGQGNEFFSENNVKILKANIGAWISAFIREYGVDNLLTVASQEPQTEFNEVTASKLAQIILAAGTGHLEQIQIGGIMMSLGQMSDQDILDCLPLDFDSEGESLSV